MFDAILFDLDGTLVDTESLAMASGMAAFARLGFPVTEDFMHGRAVADADILAEIAPCFVDEDGRKTDIVVLACTHYPFLRAFDRPFISGHLGVIKPEARIYEIVEELL